MTGAEYVVTFVGDYFTMVVCVQGVDGDEDTATDLAAAILRDRYGWDILAVSTVEVCAEPVAVAS